MVCPSVRRDNPRALARGLSTVQMEKQAISHLWHKSRVDLAHYVVSRVKDLGI